jgi:multisubunit Na+/H+ antiporter MnhF subunit
MMALDMNFLEIISASLMALAVLLGLVRLVIGPSAPDRVVAADTLAMITTVALTGFAVWFNSELYLDVALIYGTLAFVGIVAIARAIEGGR